MARLGRRQPFKPLIRNNEFLIFVPLATLSGSATSGATQTSIRAGGQQIIITLLNDTWVASGATFNAQRQNIINGLTSAQSEALGWNNVVKALQGVAGVVQTSSTVVTITLDAQATYTITAPETITVTVPGTALNRGSSVTATPTFIVSTSASGYVASQYFLILNN